jgi:hypothetical protein
MSTQLPQRLLGRKWHIAGSVLVYAITFASLTHTASAECISLSTPITTDQAFQLASLVFRGRVIEIQDPIAPALTQVVTFDVDQVWKGPVTRRQVIHHARSVDNREFAIGDRSVIFAHELSGEQRERVGLNTGPPAFGYMSFSCVTYLPGDIDSELPRRPVSLPQ